MQASFVRQNCCSLPSGKLATVQRKQMFPLYCDFMPELLSKSNKKKLRLIKKAFGSAKDAKPFKRDRTDKLERY